MGIAHRQFGVVSLEQLLACGLSYSQVRRLTDRGHLHRLHRGVFAVGHRRLVDHAHLIAALLAIGGDAFLSHRTAAAVHGLRVVARNAIEVSSPTGRPGRRRGGMIVHHTTGEPRPGDVVTRNGLRVSSLARLLIELAPRERPSELDRLITQAVRKNILDPADLQVALGRHERRPGMRKLKAALAAYAPRAERGSELESAFDQLLEADPEIPAPATNVTIDGWEIDCYWPAHKVALELDGRPYHIAARDFEKDRYKDAKLLRMGIRPLRITDHRLATDPAGALSDLRALLELG